MNRIDATFARLKTEGAAGLVVFLTAGFPTIDATLALAEAMIKGGADLIELGIPFSDPLADGATVQRASQQALDNGVTIETCLDVAARLRQRVDTPILFMGYYNPILHYGDERFAAACAEAGVDGLIVPDLPPDESAELADACDARGLDLIYLVAPTSTDERLARVAASARGFIYCVSVTGTTGARGDLAVGLPEFISRVRRHTALPLAVGFGVSTPEHVASISRFADAAVVGSALIEQIERANPQESIGQVITDYVLSLKRATGGVPAACQSGECAVRSPLRTTSGTKS